MDMYSVANAVSIGNEMATNLTEINSAREQQNAILVGNASAQLARDKAQQRTDTEEKVGMDTFNLVETSQNIADLGRRGALRGGLIKETKANFSSAGNKITNAVRGKQPAPKLVPQTTSDEDFLAESGRAMRGEDTAPVVRPSELAGREVGDVVSGGGQAGADAVADTTSGLAKGLTADKLGFESVGEAGSLSKFILNRAGGVTGAVSLEVGGKALGGLGGAISAGQDITNAYTTGHIFKKGESDLSKMGNITSMVGAGLDIASIAVPVLAPVALGVNVFSAVTSTIGAEQDDTNQISTDGKPPPTQQLAIHPAWSAVGMTASVHQPSIVG